LPTINAGVEQRQRQEDSSFFKGNIIVLAISSGIGSLGGFVGVYISKYFVQIGGNLLTVGLLASAAPLIQFFTLSIGGFLADYYGRRKIIVFAAFYGAFFPLLYAVIQDWRVFGAFTLLATIGTVATPATHAIVVDSVPPEKRTMGIASLQVVSSLPSVVSPLIGGWLIQSYGLENGFRTACIYAAVFAFVSAIPIFALLKETLHSKVVKNPVSLWREAIFGFAKPLGYTLPSSLKFLMVSYALVMFSNSAVAPYYIFYASDVVGLTLLEWGIVVSLQLLLASVVKIPGGWLSDRFGKRKTMITSLLITAPTIVLFTLSGSFIQVMAVALLLVAAGIYYAPAYEALQADFTPKSMRGRISALWLMSGAVSASLGGFFGGFTFQELGPAVPFYIFAITELGAALLLIRMVKEPETKEV